MHLFILTHLVYSLVFSPDMVTGTLGMACMLGWYEESLPVAAEV